MFFEQIHFYRCSLDCIPVVVVVTHLSLVCRYINYVQKCVEQRKSGNIVFQLVHHEMLATAADLLYERYLFNEIRIVSLKEILDGLSLKRYETVGEI